MQEIQTKFIEAYSLAEFCVALEKAVLEGYSVDTSRNETYPVAYGSHLTATLVTAYGSNDTATPEKSQEQEVSTTPAVKTGRKARSQ